MRSGRAVSKGQHQVWGGQLPPASLQCCEVISHPSVGENGTGQQTKDEAPHLLASWSHPPPSLGPWHSPHAFISPDTCHQTPLSPLVVTPSPSLPFLFPGTSEEKQEE